MNPLDMADAIGAEEVGTQVPTSYGADVLMEAWSRAFPNHPPFPSIHRTSNDDDDEDIEMLDEPTQTTDTLEPAMPLGKSWSTQVTNDATLHKDYERLLRMTQVFGKFASTLTLRNIKVHLHNDRYAGIDAPAWSDSESITFNRLKIAKLDDPKVITSLKGLSLHEIAHILLTPRDGTVIVKKVRSEKLWQAFNALEDMRIEMFMSTRFSNVSEWLTATILHFLLDNPKQMEVQFPLVYGRKYLPAKLRTMVRDAYQNPNDIAELEQLIDRYIVLNMSDPAKYNEAFDIIKRYDELIGNLNKDQGYNEGWGGVKDANGHTHGGRKNAEWKPTNGKSMNKAQQQSISIRVNTSNGSDYGKSDEPSDSDASQPSTENGNGASAGDSGRSKVTADLQEMLQDIYDSKQHEIDDTIKQFNGDAVLSAHGVATPNKPEWVRNEPVAFSTVAASRSFGGELEQLRADHDPAWDRRVETGRLNVGRYVTGCEVDEAFDQWDMGREDAVDIEAVILLDVSGSMHWCINNAYQSMWAIKRALDKVNASTTVVTFSDTTELLYSSNERASILMKYAGTGGGTEARGAIKYAHSVMANSKRSIKLVITITDGEWYDDGQSDNMLRQLRKAGVLTALAYVVNPEWISDGQVLTVNSHGCEVATNITDSRDLFTLARKLVKVGVGRNLS